MVKTSKSAIVLGLLALCFNAHADGVYTRTVNIPGTSTSSGGSTSPGGSSGQLQFNNSGSFGGMTNSVVSGNALTLGGLFSAPTAVFTSLTSTNISGATGTFTNVAGTLTTSAQPNVTSVGILTGLTSTGSISASTLYASTSLLVGPNAVSTSTPFQNKQTGTSSANGFSSESPAGVSARVYADSTFAYINRSGSAATQISIGATSVGIGLAQSTSPASLTVAGLISTSVGITLTSPTAVPACSATNAGTTLYNSATKCLNYCDGTAYRQVTSVAASCT